VLLSYLRTYGNTRETDLIEYGTRLFGQSKEEIVAVIKKMMLEGYAQRIVHDKLGSDIVYIAEGDLPLDLALQINANVMGLKDKGKVIEEARKILDEATAKAEKRIRKILSAR